MQNQAKDAFVGQITIHSFERQLFDFEPTTLHIRLYTNIQMFTHFPCQGRRVVLLSLRKAFM
jgi:hypothetical protein